MSYLNMFELIKLFNKTFLCLCMIYVTVKSLKESFFFFWGEMNMNFS